MTTPFPFIVGCGRSGTTLVRAMLDSHPDVAVPDEVAFIIRYSRPHHALAYGWPRHFDAARCRDLILGDASFRRWPLTDAEARAILSDPLPTSFADTIRRLYTGVAAAQGKRRYADKTPMHVLHLQRLAGLFPEARFVHVIRDGRDVALSYLRVPWGPTTITDAALRWRRSVRRGRSAGTRLGGDRYREIRYEHLVTDPEAVLRPLCSFLQLDWDDAVLRPDARADTVIAATRFPNAHGRLRLPPARNERDWRDDMSAVDVASFEAIAGRELDELGYCRAAGWPPPVTRLRSRGCIVADDMSRAWTQLAAGGRVVARQLSGRR